MPAHAHMRGHQRSLEVSEDWAREVCRSGAKLGGTRQNDAGIGLSGSVILSPWKPSGNLLFYYRYCVLQLAEIDGYVKTSHPQRDGPLGMERRPT